MVVDEVHGGKHVVGVVADAEDARTHPSELHRSQAAVDGVSSEARHHVAIVLVGRVLLTEERYFAIRRVVRHDKAEDGAIAEAVALAVQLDILGDAALENEGAVLANKDEFGGRRGLAREEPLTHVRILHGGVPAAPEVERRREHCCDKPSECATRRVRATKCVLST